MQKRADYNKSISSSISALNQYIYTSDYAILRLEHGLTPTQAKEYEKIFNEIMNNN
ncbi:MAG: hypothetical protein HFJ52_03065 [Clostridia bacterium]|nr:hypothetical protein [Clostridia bacterium]